MAELEYDPTVDYRVLIQDFANHHKVWCGDGDYAKSMSITFKHFECLNWPQVDNHFWFKWFCNDLALQYQIKLKKNAIQQQLTKIPDLGCWIFLTLGFDDTTDIDAPKMLELTQSVLNANISIGVPLLEKSIYVLEKHRTDSSGKQYIHHHVHILAFMSQHVRPSKIAQIIHRIKGMRKYIKTPNFIDIKTPNAKNFSQRAQPFEVCQNYIKGIKQSSKQPCIEKDTVWRELHNIAPYYEN